MRITRIKEDITAINIELFRRQGITVKFRVKTYYEGYNNQLTYYHKEYVFNTNNSRRASLNIIPKSYIQIDLGNEEGKNLFFMGEMFKNKFIRKTSKLAALLEAYDANEIDIIKVDSSGTHINNNFPKTEKIIMGRSKIIVDVVIREDKNDVGVSLKFDDFPEVVISLLDFLDLHCKLKDLNYLSTAMSALNYLGSPELGIHETDLRAPGVFEQNKEISGESKSYNPMNDFSNISDPRTLTKTNRIKW